MQRWVLIGVAVVLLGVALLWARRAVYVFLRERAELTAEVPAEPLPAGAPEAVRELRYPVSGIEQRAFYLPSRNGALIVLLHGSPSSAVAHVLEAGALARAGYGLLLLDLPGYGGSGGERTWGASYRASVKQAIDYAIKEQPELRIGGFGFSMGSSVIASAATEDPRIEALALRGAFTTLTAQLEHAFKSGWPFVTAIAPATARLYGVALEQLDTEAALRKLGDRNVLLFAGEADHTTPPEMSEALAKAAPNIEIERLPETTHLVIPKPLQSRYLQRLIAHFDRAFAEL